MILATTFIQIFLRIFRFEQNVRLSGRSIDVRDRLLTALKYYSLEGSGRQKFIKEEEVGAVPRE